MLGHGQLLASQSKLNEKNCTKNSSPLSCILEFDVIETLLSLGREHYYCAICSVKSTDT